MVLLDTKHKALQMAQAKIRHNSTRTVMAFALDAFEDSILDTEHMGSSDICTGYKTVHLEHECEKIFDLTTLIPSNSVPKFYYILPLCKTEFKGILHFCSIY